VTPQQWDGQLSRDQPTRCSHSTTTAACAYCVRALRLPCTYLLPACLPASSRRCCWRVVRDTTARAAAAVAARPTACRRAPSSSWPGASRRRWLHGGGDGGRGAGGIGVTALRATRCGQHRPTCRLAPSSPPRVMCRTLVVRGDVRRLGRRIAMLPHAHVRRLPLDLLGGVVVPDDGLGVGRHRLSSVKQGRWMGTRVRGRKARGQRG
jgi:hypothetical protein